MARVWAERGGDGHAQAREAKYKYQRKEMELEEERTALSRLNADLRAKREELARAKRGVEKRQLEILHLERQQHDLTRLLEDLERRVASQKSHVARLEHESEQLREAAFRHGGCQT